MARSRPARVVADQHGDLAGFAGVLHVAYVRARLLAGRGWCQFMVHPSARRSLIALQLVKTVLRRPGPFVTDGSNELARRVWLGIGGNGADLQNLD